jgi:mannose/fructose/N-acetylgalactosamine-specific phosphotransferase system component IIB
VVIAWGGRLRPARIWVADDAIAASDWERELLRSAAPDAEVRVTVDRRAAAAWAARRRGRRRVPAGARSARALALHRAGARFERLNLGGLHYAPGKTKVNEYVYLDERDREARARWLARGVRSRCRTCGRGATGVRSVPRSGHRDSVSPPAPAAAPSRCGGVAALDAEPVAPDPAVAAAGDRHRAGLPVGRLATAFEVGIVLQVLAASTAAGRIAHARGLRDRRRGRSRSRARAREHQPFTIAKQGCAMLGRAGRHGGRDRRHPAAQVEAAPQRGLARWCEEAVRAGDPTRRTRARVRRVVLSFALGVTYTALCLGRGCCCSSLAAKSRCDWRARWSLARPLWLGLGLAQVLTAFLQRRLTRGVAFGTALLARGCSS